MVFYSINNKCVHKFYNINVSILCTVYNDVYYKAILLDEVEVRLRSVVIHADF